MKGFWSEDQEKNKIFSITFGPEGTKMIHAMHDAMIAYANNGVNSVADYITYEPWWIPELKEKCGQHNIPLYLIKIDASLEEIQKRELERGSFPACQARSHYNTVRNRINYFLEIDNETH
jgi:chloramphenicol 3-O-phosphotransferase